MTGNQFRMIRRYLGYTQKKFGKILGVPQNRVSSAESTLKKKIPPSLENTIRKCLDPELILNEIISLKNIPREERMHEFNVRRFIYDIERRDSELSGRSNTTKKKRIRYY